MTEFDLQISIIRNNSPLVGKLIIPNICGRFGEMDVLQLSKAGYTTEYEIKVTRNDFWADRKKQIKHRHYEGTYKKEYPPSEGTPNYFVYVVPESLKLQASDVPEYAGLYTVAENSSWRWIKSIKCPPKIHKEKFKEFWITKIAHSFNAKYLYHYFFRQSKCTDQSEFVDCRKDGEIKKW